MPCGIEISNLARPDWPLYTLCEPIAAMVHNGLAALHSRANRTGRRPGRRRARAPHKDRSPVSGGNMSIIAWIVLGLIAGFIGSQIVKGEGSGVVGDIIVGVVGALVGGFL